MQKQPSLLKEESWQLDSSGLFFCSPSFVLTHPHLVALTTTKVAGNMGEAAQRTKLLRRLDIDSKRVALSYQTHGKGIHVMDQVTDIPQERVEGVDGWIASRASGAAFGVFTADCLPVFVVHKEGAWSALLHVGWRGLRQGIVEEAFKTLFDQSCCQGKDFTAMIGPHIRSCCYEVGPDLHEAFGVFVVERGGKFYLDLEACVASKLESFEIAEVAVADLCTRCSNASLFFSYRRKERGSQLSIFSFL